MIKWIVTLYLVAIALAATPTPVINSTLTLPIIRDETVDKNTGRVLLGGDSLLVSNTSSSKTIGLMAYDMTLFNGTFVDATLTFSLTATYSCDPNTNGTCSGALYIILAPRNFTWVEGSDISSQQGLLNQDVLLQPSNVVAVPISAANIQRSVSIAKLVTKAQSTGGMTEMTLILGVTNGLFKTPSRRSIPSTSMIIITKVTPTTMTPTLTPTPTPTPTPQTTKNSTQTPTTTTTKTPSNTTTIAPRNNADKICAGIFSTILAASLLISM
jgi:hypothetical protein